MSIHRPVNHLNDQIRLNLLLGDPVEKAITRPNVIKALEILAGQMDRRQKRGEIKWLKSLGISEVQNDITKEKASALEKQLASNLNTRAI